MVWNEDDMTTQMEHQQTVGIVGCGLMGAGIAEVCVRSGLDAIVCESDAASAERGRSRIVVARPGAASFTRRRVPLLAPRRC